MTKTNTNPKNKLKEVGLDLISKIKKGENPSLDIPIRALSNVTFDPHTNLIKIGDKIYYLVFHLEISIKNKTAIKVIIKAAKYSI